MISSSNFFKRKSKSRLSKRKAGEIAPEEILLDASNLPNFDTDQFEGRFERPIKPSTITITTCLFLIIGLFLAGRFFDLEIARGASYAQESAQNTLRQTPIFADRGVIYDKNGVELAWNEPFSPSSDYSERTYINEPGLSDLLGFVSYPKQDSSGNYYDSAIVGKDGVEKSENQTLSGIDGEEIVEVQRHFSRSRRPKCHALDRFVSHQRII
jgi:penicillin-binding protein 2